MGGMDNRVGRDWKLHVFSIERDVVNSHVVYL